MRAPTIRPAQAAEHPALIRLWERSVRATHFFLPESYLQEIKTLLPSLLLSVELYVFEDERLKGFVGCEGRKMEMLFIDPDYRGAGIGRQLLRFAMDQLLVTQVDVNEQNEAACRFYLNNGFVPAGRTETDGLGRRFPILHLQLSKEHLIKSNINVSRNENV